MIDVTRWHKTRMEGWEGKSTDTFFQCALYSLFVDRQSWNESLQTRESQREREREKEQKRSEPRQTLTASLELCSGRDKVLLKEHVEAPRVCLASDASQRVVLAGARKRQDRERKRGYRQERGEGINGRVIL